MGPNYIVKCDEDLCCPVCKLPLSNPGSPPKPRHQKLGTKGNYKPPPAPTYSQYHKEKEGNRSLKPSPKESDDVVVAQCGHLFHKFCLRHYCYLFREGRFNQFNKVTCPICRRGISMSSAQTILYREHQNISTDSEKEGTKTSIMNNELSDQVKVTKTKLVNLDQQKEEAMNNLELYRSHWKKIKKDLKKVKDKSLEIENLHSEIHQTDKLLALMQTQHLKIVRKFIGKVKGKNPKDFIHFPRRLAQYLTLIEKDDKLVRDLGEVIMPIHLNHLKSDRQSLLKGILEAVNGKLSDTRSDKPRKEVKGENVKETRSLEDVPKINPFFAFPNAKRPPIFVKVRKSSVSILSSTRLTKASIKKIIDTVQTQGEDTIEAAKKEFLQNKDDVDLNNSKKVSASDIKVIYMPKRKMVEPMSEPCRAIEPSDSFFVKVPPRRCMSTNAILMKERRKKKRDAKISIIAEGNAGIEAVPLGPKRSRSAEAILACGKRAESARCSRKPSALIAIVSMPDIKDTDADNVPEEVHGDDTMMATEPHQDENNNSINSNENEGDAASCNDSENVKERISVLQILYEDLEEERRSNHHFEKINSVSRKTLIIKNDHEMLKPLLPPPLTKPRTPVIRTEEQYQPQPKFFRIDGKGNIRPESPYRMHFRQPTFLSSLTDIIKDKPAFMAGCTEPDEENQLDALSPEDRYLLAAEQEVTAMRKGGKAQMLFELPACLGVPPEGTSSYQQQDQQVPVYLKRWQNQLPSQKNYSFDSPTHPFTPIAHCRSARMVQKRSTQSVNRQRPRMGLVQKQTPSTLKPREKVHLPPLHMFPSKRPSTADCIRARVEETYFPFERGRLTETLPRVYDMSNTISPNPESVRM